MWNFRYMLRLVSCLFVCIAMVIAFYISQLCTINCLEYLNPPVLFKLFLENPIYIQQVRIKIYRNSKIIKLATMEHFIFVYSIVIMYFWNDVTSYWLISTRKCQYHESYDIKRDYSDFKFYSLVQSKKTPT